MRWSTRLFLGAGAVAFAGCDPSLPEATWHGDGDGSGAPRNTSAYVVTVEPPSALEAVPRVARFRISGAGSLDPASVALAEGKLGPRQLASIARQDISPSLEERLIAARVWREGDDLVLAPEAPLAAGGDYTLAAVEGTPLHVTEEDSIPLLARVWPPPGEGASFALAVWCGEGALSEVDTPARLAPDGPEGHLRRGAVSGAGARCLRFESPSMLGAGEWSPPPLVAAGPPRGAAVRLDPAPVRAAGAAGAAIPLLLCEADEIAFGPGCVKVADDRLTGRSPEAPLLWAVAGGRIDQVFAAGAGDPFVITGLPPSTEVALDVAAIDARGTVLRKLIMAVTAAPMSHVVINEVLANPLGPEPEAEWVEIVNDGRAPQDLGGYALLDGGGETPLPPVTLAPGAFALVVNEGFSEQDGADPCPAPGTLILRVPHLGKNGLSNSGEALSLRDDHGVLISRSPAAPKPKAGRSVARRSPSLPDGAPGAFALAEPSPGRTNVF